MSRRGLLLAGTATAALTGCSADIATRDGAGKSDTSTAVSPYGRWQTGIAQPQPPQRNLQLSVWDLAREDTAALIAELGEVAAALMSGRHRAVREFEPARLTVTVAVGPAVVARVDAELPGARRLPRFAREEYAADRWDGDLAVQVCTDDPAVQVAAVAALHGTLPSTTSLRWSQTGARGSARADGSTRNLLGFVDGTIAPRTRTELTENVWLPGPEPVRDGSVMVVRRMRVDTAAFQQLDTERQEEVIGRRKSSGGPLPGSRKIESSGRIGDELDLDAKTPAGQYVVPAGAHARRAHPRFTGSHVMLRRSYGFDNGPTDTGLLFISFQRDLRTFVTTQQRMDSRDDLMEFTTTTASGTFLVLPGHTKKSPLGRSLFA